MLRYSEPSYRGRIASFALLVATALAVVPGEGRAARSDAEAAYERARRTYFALRASPDRQRYRHHWLKAIAAFRSVQSQHPKSPSAAAAAYTAAELWADLYKVSRRGSDLDQALDAYAGLVEAFPRSSFADDALWQQAQIELNHRRDRAAAASHLATVQARYPKGDMAARSLVLAKTLPRAKPSAPAPKVGADIAKGTLVGRREETRVAQVTGTKQWSTAEYSRVVVYLSSPAQARASVLGDAQAAGQPVQIAADIRAATLASGAPTTAVVDDALVRDLELVQQDKDTVRVLLGLKQPATPRVLVMENPYRIVIDVQALEAAPAVASDALIKRRPHVVLDPGHGGKDCGASGPHGAREKDVVLAIARAAKSALEARNIRVTLTRTGDTFVPLEERTALANHAEADLFISIHANSHRGRSARGIETYYLNVTDDRYALRLAAVENQTSEEQVSDLQLILADLSVKAHAARSQQLARDIQARLVRTARQHKVQTRDLGTKASLFYVLVGARMPAVLVETAFISNATEERLLTNPAYQRAIAQAIVDAAEAHARAAGPPKGLDGSAPVASRGL